MTTVHQDSRLTLKSLRARRNSVEDRLSVNLRTRARRVLSWLERAQLEDDDPDAAFVFYWITFDAISTERSLDKQPKKEVFKRFFEKVAEADRRNAIRDYVLGDLFDTILEVVANPYMFEPFWDYYNGGSGSEDDWQDMLVSDVERVSVHLESENIVEPLAVLFERLYVLRNQLFHGEATWNRYVNRSQIEGGAEIMAFIVPALVDLMMDKPDMFDQPSRYPSVESDTAQIVEDVIDYSLTVNVLRRVRNGQEKVYSSEEVRKGLGLDD